MNKVRIGILISLAVLAVATCVQAESFWSGADEAAPWVVRYKDSAATGTLTIEAGQVVTSDGGTTNAYVFADDSTPTLGETIAAINNTTNSSGLKNFEAKLWCGLAADVVTNGYLVAKAATTLDYSWSYAFKWDTTGCDHFNVAASIMVGNQARSAGKVDRIWGFPTGTGASTQHIYVNGTIRWIDVVATNPAKINEAINSLWVGNQVCFFRCDNATSATDVGGIGISTTP